MLIDHLNGIYYNCDIESIKVIKHGQECANVYQDGGGIA